MGSSGINAGENERKEQITKSKKNGKLKEGKYKCQECDKGFKNSKFLQYHTESSHLGIKRFFCRNCSYKCYFALSIRNHMESKHHDPGRILRIGCEECDIE